jgi:sugar phosphate isomerase/epimerase
MTTEFEDRFPICMEVSVDTLKSDAELAALRVQGIKYLSVKPAFYDLDEQTVKERFRRLTALGFVVDTCHPPYGGGNHQNSVCAEDETVRQTSIAMWRHYLRAFSMTGMRAVPLHTGGAMNAAGGKKALGRLTDTLEKILPEAKKSGVIIALENTFFENPCPFSDAPNPSGIDFTYINDDCEMLRAYVEKWDDANIRVCHDVGHSMLYGHSVGKDMDTLSPLTVLYHIHDNDGVRDRHWNVGDGVFPWQTLVDKLLKNDFRLPLYDEVLSDKNAVLKPMKLLPEQVAAHFSRARSVINTCVGAHRG